MKRFGILKDIEKLRRRVRAFDTPLLLQPKKTEAEIYAPYRNDPAGYATDILRIDWWAKQKEIARLACTPPYRVLVKASHSVGKSHLAGGLVNWWYDTHDPGVCITTAPTSRQVKDILWKEVRRQRGSRGGFPGPKIARLESSESHFAHGFTSTTSTSFQGQHEAAIMILLDEAVGVGREIWEGADGMVMGKQYCIIAFCNPTDAGSEFYQREARGGWHVVHIPCTEHPNIAAELAGLPAPYPSAVRLAWLEERLEQWASPVSGDPLPTDLEWPPNSGKWLRPGPLCEARLLGRWPSAASGVWSDVLWASAEVQKPEPNFNLFIPELSCDVARFGDDDSEMHVRVNNTSYHHERHNGWSTTETAGRLKQLCREWAAWINAKRDESMKPVEPEHIRVKIDDDGVGGGVVDQRGDFNFIPISSARVADRPDDYPNVRSELWFNVAEGRAKKGKLDLSRLPADVRRELKRQAMAPHYKLDGAGRRVVEPKDITKKTIGRSPDGMDALNLAYYDSHSGDVPEWIDTGDRRSRRRF